jgi:hypothetical protein
MSSISMVKCSVGRVADTQGGRLASSAYAGGRGADKHTQGSEGRSPSCAHVGHLKACYTVG